MTVLQISEHEYIGVAADSKPAAAARAKFYETDTGRTYIYTGSAWVRYLPAASDGARNRFIGQLLSILGDTRLLWTPLPTDTLTSTDESLNARTFNWNATIAAQIERLGLGYAVTFDGTTDYASVIDAAGLTFGTGTADVAFSIVALILSTNTASAKQILSKNDNAAQQEWEFSLGSTELLNVKLFDESAGVAAQRSSNAAITLDAWTLLGMTYTAATGGATAANDITLYENGVVKASTATNNAGYVAMEDKSSPVGLGMYIPSAPALFFPGKMALVALCQKALTANEHWAIRQLAQGHFGFLG